MDTTTKQTEQTYSFICWGTLNCNIYSVVKFMHALYYRVKEEKKIELNYFQSLLLKRQVILFEKKNDEMKDHTDPEKKERFVEFFNMFIDNRGFIGSSLHLNRPVGSISAAFRSISTILSISASNNNYFIRTEGKVRKGLNWWRISRGLFVK